MLKIIGSLRLRQQRWTRLLAAGLACVLAAACTSPVREEATPTNAGSQATPTSAASQSPTQRDYWPTAGWRTAEPD
jgi:hypothetical protein